MIELCLTVIHSALHEVIDDYCAERGLKPLEEYERRPILQSFYAKYKQGNLPPVSYIAPTGYSEPTGYGMPVGYAPPAGYSMPVQTSSPAPMPPITTPLSPECGRLLRGRQPLMRRQ